MSTETTLREVFGKVLQTHEITDDMSPATVPAWDSFNALMLIAELEKSFNVKFALSEVTAVQNVGDIKALLRTHGVTI